MTIGVCDAGGVPSGLTRGQFNPTGIQWPPEPTYLSDTIAIHAPARVKAGSTLVYYVSIANTSNLDYRLNPCPDYNEFLGPKVVIESYRLNCTPVAHIAPASMVTFEMRMKIPNVIGQTQQAAETQLKAAGLQVTSQPVANDQMLSGNVFDQDPKGGVKQPKGSTVTIKVTGTIWPYRPKPK